MRKSVDEKDKDREPVINIKKFNLTWRERQTDIQS